MMRSMLIQISEWYQLELVAHNSLLYYSPQKNYATKPIYSLFRLSISYSFR